MILFAIAMLVGVTNRWIESLKSVPGAISELVESKWVRGWALSDPVSALEWMLQNSSERSAKRLFLLPIVLYQHAEVDSERASELAEKYDLLPYEIGRQN